MAEIINATKKVVKKETVTLTVSFEYELVDGQFQSAEDEAHHNKYVAYVDSSEDMEG